MKRVERQRRLATARQDEIDEPDEARRFARRCLRDGENVFDALKRGDVMQAVLVETGRHFRFVTERISGGRIFRSEYIMPYIVWTNTKIIPVRMIGDEQIAKVEAAK